MWQLLKFVLGLVLVLVLAASGIYFTGNTFNVIVWIGKPDHGWDLSKKAPEPDYAQSASWAARPGTSSLAESVPQGVAARTGDGAVDVFFIHPTGYMSGTDWNSPINLKSQTEENTNWMLANQASAFNGCCNVYAPRYREASIYSYFAAPPDLAQKALDFAYADVVRAFEYYMAHDNKGKPFIIASHSQGTSHALRLITEKIDGTNRAGAMIAAYIIGSDVTNTKVSALKTVKVCNNPTEANCLVHWATMGDGGTPSPDMKDLVCVNPLTWLRDGPRAEATLHQGAVPTSGKFSLWAYSYDAPQRVEFKPLAAPMPKATWAECRDGLLFVADQTGTPFAKLSIPGKNYHGLDYPLFHMDIRENVKSRVQAYLMKALRDGPAPTPASAPPQAPPAQSNRSHPSPVTN